MKMVRYAAPKSIRRGGAKSRAARRLAKLTLPTKVEKPRAS